MTLRYRILLKVAYLLEWYLERLEERCPCCETEMGRLVPFGPVCLNPQCEAYCHNLAAARMVASGER